MEPMQTERIPANVQELPLSETLSTVRQRAGEACEYTDQVVRANPWTSTGVGFGAGILIGALAALAISQRSRRGIG